MVAAATAGCLLVLGANGTLSAWASSVITNPTNSAAAVHAALLQESSGAAVCHSYDAATNSSSCSTINKYGGLATLLSPGQSTVPVDVTFSNVGSINGSAFALTSPSPFCTQNPTTPTAGDLCGGGSLTVSIRCSAGTTFNSAAAWNDLSYNGIPSGITGSHTAIAGDLNIGSPWTCEVVATLSPSAPNNTQGVVVTQPLMWTLS
ncbi:hypothetical protein Back2_28910 [Nocardioides baekrokdamisoli]|uniref:Ig-like domain-containing protein n=1 Tax=Nocardioides baekrokdamisoli TaxID=1804624 RepID=A0A3G9J5J5_9ACTN|nr:hypothetical protein Back2_28910 [Nocardioides baekrokdamisoli]